MPGAPCLYLEPHACTWSHICRSRSQMYSDERAGCQNTGRAAGRAGTKFRKLGLDVVRSVWRGKGTGRSLFGAAGPWVGRGQNGPGRFGRSTAAAIGMCTCCVCVCRRKFAGNVACTHTHKHARTHARARAHARTRACLHACLHTCQHSWPRMGLGACLYACPHIFCTVVLGAFLHRLARTSCRAKTYLPSA